jgi:hypothetical protein
MAQSPYLKANCSSASQEIPRILWTQKVYDFVHKNSPSVAIMSQLKPLPYWRSILVLSSHLRLDLLSGLFPIKFQYQGTVWNSPLFNRAICSGFRSLHSVSLGCVGRRRPTDTETSFQRTKYAFFDSRQWVSSQHAGWTRSWVFPTLAT